MTKKGKLSGLLGSYDTFGSTVVKYFGRLPPSYFETLSFDHWNAILRAAHERLQNTDQKKRKVIKRLKKIKKLALSVMICETQESQPKSPPINKSFGRMFVEKE